MHLRLAVRVPLGQSQTRTVPLQLSGSLFDRMQGLAKIQKTAKSALSSELSQLAKAKRAFTKGSQGVEDSTPGT